MAGTITTSTSKGIAIGIIGPEQLVRKMDHCLKGFPSFAPITCIYKSEDEVPTLARELMDRVEALLFTGPVPYRVAVDKISFHIPVHYVRLSGTGLYRALFRIMRRYGLAEMSVDTLSKQSVEDAFGELGEPYSPTFHYTGLESMSKEPLIEFHAESYRSGRTKVALTSVGAVAAALTEMGIPNEWVMPTDEDIIVSLERSLL
ncbi:MAG: hypothetical protein K0Q59_4546, partial [Paenibacillus sp.]|nr:hypothetical protein [Paenibacillus sp.]